MIIERHNKIKCDICCKTVVVKGDKKSGVWFLKNGEETEPWELEKPVTIKYDNDMFGPAKLSFVTMDICPECYQRMIDCWPITISKFEEESKYKFTKESEDEQ